MLDDLERLVKKTRSFRRFCQNESIDKAILKRLVNLARLAGSARNVQPLKYMLINEPDQAAQVFSHLAWAGYLHDWPGPQDGERPSAYIICLLDSLISAEADCDLGIATQNILLGATAMGLGGCRIGSISPKLKGILGIADHLKIILVLAIGKPKETVLLEDLGPENDIKYWRDGADQHHVPKRSLTEIIVENSK